MRTNAPGWMTSRTNDTAQAMGQLPIHDSCSLFSDENVWLKRRASENFARTKTLPIKATVKLGNDYPGLLSLNDSSKAGKK